jgi:hypothetical protein
MGYLDGLRGLVLNEIEVAGKKPEDDTQGEESDNFMDDTDDTPQQDTSSPTPDDTGDEGESDNFMDDDDDAGEQPPAEGDTTGDTGEDEGESDNFMDDGDSAGDNTSDDTGEQPPAEGDTTDGDTGEDKGESDNFMDDGGEGGGDEGSAEDSGEEGEDTGEQQEGEGEENSDEFGIDKIEDELFSSLTPEQKAIKNEELKNQFINLYSVIGTTLDRINEVSKSNENVQALAFVTQKLLELREMIDYTITRTYDTRTYIENNIIYQQCISILNLISEMIENIPNVNGNDEDQTDDNYKGEPVDPEDDNKEIKSLDISDTSVSDYQAESAGFNTLF